MLKFKKLPLAIGIFAAVLALAGPALSDTSVELMVGPAPIPEVPVEVCVTQIEVPEAINECVTTPEARSVSLTVIVNVDTPEPVWFRRPSRPSNALPAPTVLPCRC